MAYPVTNLDVTVILVTEMSHTCRRGLLRDPIVGLYMMSDHPDGMTYPVASLHMCMLQAMQLHTPVDLVYP